MTDGSENSLTGDRLYQAYWEGRAEERNETLDRVKEIVEGLQEKSIIHKRCYRNIALEIEQLRIK